MYTFFNTLFTLLLLLSRGDAPLLSNFSFFGRLDLVGCAAVKPSASTRAGVSTAKHAPVSTDSSPLPFSSTSDWLPSCWTCCVIGVLYLVSSVSFSCPLPRIPSGSPLPASVPRSGVSRLPWCHFCLSPPAQVCIVALDLVGGVISLCRRVFHFPSPAPFLRALCGLSSATLLPPVPCPSVCLLFLVRQ